MKTKMKVHLNVASVKRLTTPMMGWLKRHELSCSPAGGKAKKTQVLSDHQTTTRKILAGLGFEEYFERECLPVIVNCLQEITSTPNKSVAQINLANRARIFIG